MNNIIEKFENKLSKDSVILALLVISDRVEYNKIELNIGELLLLDVPPVVPEYVLSVNSFLANIATEKISEKAKVGSRFFQLINKSKEDKNEFGMLVSMGNRDIDERLVNEIQGELVGFLKGIGGQDFHNNGICSPFVEKQINYFLKRFGSKKIAMPFAAFFGDDDSVSFTGDFVGKPDEKDINLGEHVIEGQIDCPSITKKKFNVIGEKKHSGIQFELDIYFGKLAYYHWKRTHIKFTVSRWMINGKYKLILKGLEVFEGPQKAFGFIETD